MGAYWGSISISTSVRAPVASSSFFLTCPTSTPEIRTAASGARVAASGIATLKR